MRTYILILILLIAFSNLEKSFGQEKKDTLYFLKDTISVIINDTIFNRDYKYYLAQIHTTKSKKLEITFDVESNTTDITSYLTFFVTYSRGHQMEASSLEKLSTKYHPKKGYEKKSFKHSSKIPSNGKFNFHFSIFVFKPLKQSTDAPFIKLSNVLIVGKR